MPDGQQLIRRERLITALCNTGARIVDACELGRFLVLAWEGGQTVIVETVPDAEGRPLYGRTYVPAADARGMGWVMHLVEQYLGTPDPVAVRGAGEPAPTFDRWEPVHAHGG